MLRQIYFPVARPQRQRSGVARDVQIGCRKRRAIGSDQVSFRLAPSISIPKSELKRKAQDRTVQHLFEMDSDAATAAFNIKSNGLVS